MTYVPGNHSSWSSLPQDYQQQAYRKIRHKHTLRLTDKKLLLISIPPP